jgi:hypothetical protein
MSFLYSTEWKLLNQHRSLRTVIEMPIVLPYTEQAKFAVAPLNREFALLCAALALPILVGLLLFALCHFNAISVDQINDAFGG